MSTTSHTIAHRPRFHHDAYQFLFAALRHTQRKLERIATEDEEGLNEEEAHITGQELLEGVRDLAIKQFGLLTRQVFAHWGIHATADFWRMVFELVERGEMKKTEHDQFSDFIEVFDFAEAFDTKYRINTSHAFMH